MTRILVKDKHSPRVSRMTVASYVQNTIENTYSGGAMEGLDDRLRSTASVLGELVELLFDKGVLTLDEVRGIVPYGSLETLELADG